MIYRQRHHSNSIFLDWKVCLFKCSDTLSKCTGRAHHRPDWAPIRNHGDYKRYLAFGRHQPYQQPGQAPLKALRLDWVRPLWPLGLQLQQHIVLQGKLPSPKRSSWVPMGAGKLYSTWLQNRLTSLHHSSSRHLLATSKIPKRMPKLPKFRQILITAAITASILMSSGLEECCVMLIAAHLILCARYGTCLILGVLPVKHNYVDSTQNSRGVGNYQSSGEFSEDCATYQLEYLIEEKGAVQGSVSTGPLNSAANASDASASSKGNLINLTANEPSLSLPVLAPGSLPSQEPKRSRDVLDMRGKSPEKRANFGLA